MSVMNLSIPNFVSLWGHLCTDRAYPSQPDMMDT